MSIEKQYVSFNDDFTDWQYASGVIIPKQRGLMIENITIYCAYDYNANYAYFTNISLVLEPAETYSYDSKGNPIAADSGCNWMGTRLASTGYTFGSNSRSFTYTYDASGNITRIGVSGGSLTVGTKSKTYSYDALGQLVKETPGGLARNAVNYTYDTAGNIRSVTKGNTSSATLVKSFGYTNPSWPDLLTSVTANGTTKDVLYEGQSQTSDLPTSGNPVTYYNGRDYHFDWSKGRQLTEAVVGGQTVKYAYDMAGVRSSKQVGDTTYSYTTLSGKVMRQAWGDNNALEFVYDDSSQPFAVIYKHGSAAELYYYLVNAQGDVAAILDSSGTMVAFYDYDAWGNCTVYNSSAKVLTDPTSIANIYRQQIHAAGALTWMYNLLFSKR